MRVAFSRVFKDNGNGTYTPIHEVKIGDITIGPGGFSFTPGVWFSGIDVGHYVDHDLEIEERENGTLEILDVY